VQRALEAKSRSKKSAPAPAMVGTDSDTESDDGLWSREEQLARREKTVEDVILDDSDSDSANDSDDELAREEELMRKQVAEQKRRLQAFKLKKEKTRARKQDKERKARARREKRRALLKKHEQMLQEMRRQEQALLREIDEMGDSDEACDSDDEPRRVRSKTSSLRHRSRDDRVEELDSMEARALETGDFYKVVDI